MLIEFLDISSFTKIYHTIYNLYTIFSIQIYICHILLHIVGTYIIDNPYKERIESERFTIIHIIQI